jgi:hypothetical protein
MGDGARSGGAEPGNPGDLSEDLGNESGAEVNSSISAAVNLKTLSSPFNLGITKALCFLAFSSDTWWS